MKTQPTPIMVIVVLGLAAQVSMAQASSPGVPKNLKIAMNFCSKTAPLAQGTAAGLGQTATITGGVPGPAIPGIQVGGGMVNGNPNCTTGMVYEGASVVVTKVKVNQLAGPSGCKADEKVYSKNMTHESKFGVLLRKDCEYRVQFNTTSGCTGDKAVKITVKDMASAPPVTVATLEGGCGTLSGNKYKFQPK